MKKVINKLVKTVKNFPKKTFYLFGGPAARYWGWLLVFLGTAFAVVVAFDIYFFVSTNKVISADTVLPAERRPLSVDRESLAKAVKIIEKREKEYSDILINPSPTDPAL